MSLSPLPTIETVALRAKVSISTVSRALRNDRRISKATVERVKTIAAELGYRPNPLISALMAHLRTTKPVEYQATIAYLETSFDPKETQSWSSSRQHYQSVCDRAGQLGYGVDRFWFHEPDVSPRQLVKILQSRGIQGLIIHYLPTLQNQFHELPIDLGSFAVAALGSKMDSPSIHYACSDHYAVMQLALEELQKLGYRRIGVAIDSYVDNIVEGRFLGAYLRWEEGVAKPDRVPHFVTADFAEESFAKWFRETKPNVIICIDAQVLSWLENLKIPIPEAVGVVHLDVPDNFPRMSGVRQRHDMVGVSSVDLIVGQLHRNERGVPATPKASFSGGEWVHAETVVRQPSASSPKPLKKARK